MVRIVEVENNRGQLNEITASAYAGAEALQVDIKQTERRTLSLELVACGAQEQAAAAGQPRSPPVPVRSGLN